eukprot:GHVR01025580.1.p1 GENE.GHVR01025580.1~~GHVR01025580.1.p1  ORF type:complete len:133 (+),score=36.72 GHVR01025580.1:34-432(+)
MATRSDGTLKGMQEEDVKLICKFSRLWPAAKKTAVEIKDIENKLRSLNDASDEMQLAMGDDDLMIRVADCFFSTDETSTQQHIDSEINTLTQEKNVLESLYYTQKNDVLTLKALIKAKFGDTVNTEDGEVLD